MYAVNVKVHDVVTKEVIAEKDGFASCKEVGYWLDEYFYNDDDHFVVLRFEGADTCNRGN